MAGSLTAEVENVATLKGMPGNPGRDPKRAKDGAKGSIGDKAFTDGVCIVIAAWLFLLFLVISLRHHNV